MAILSDKDILYWAKEGGLIIQNFNEENLTPNGYDVTIEEVLYEEKMIKKGSVKIQPLKWFVVSTKEYFKTGNELAAQLWLRTSWIRKGIIASFGKVDAGFEGALTLPAFNASKKPVKINIGDRFAQVVFETLSSKPLKSYKERSGRYQGQRGIVLEPAKGKERASAPKTTTQRSRT